MRKFYSFPTSIEAIIPEPSMADLAHALHSDARSLYEAYEADFLYLDDKGGIRKQPKIAANRRQLADNVFHAFDALIDPSAWQIGTPDIIDFFWNRVDEETALLGPDGLSPDYAEITSRPDAAEVCRFYMSQFALDYLTEASPLTRALPGSFGDIQMAIFKIVADEYGNGDLDLKHSVLFQCCLRSIGMPDQLEPYRDGILPSVYMYMNYVNRVAERPDLFFRFLGFLFVYEACLIFPTQQQGMMLREVFGSKTDTRYFDFHVEIDQGHGVWVVKNMLIPTVKRFGETAAREILRGYHETNLLLRLCDWEMEQALAAGVHRELREEPA